MADINLIVGSNSRSLVKPQTKDLSVRPSIALTTKVKTGKSDYALDPSKNEDDEFLKEIQDPELLADFKVSIVELAAEYRLQEAKLLEVYAKDADKHGIKGEAKEKFIEEQIGLSTISGRIGAALTNELKELELSADEQPLFVSGFADYLQSRISNHLKDIFPDDFFEELDRLVIAGEIDGEEVMGIILLAYEAAMGIDFNQYAQGVVKESLPGFEEIYKQSKEDFTKVLNLTKEQQSKLQELLDADDLDGANEFVSSLG